MNKYQILLSGIKTEKGIREHSAQRGATAFEILLYVGLVALLVVGVFGIYQLAFGSSKVQTEKQNMQAIIGQVNNLYGTNRDFGTANITTVLANTKAAPAPMIVGTGLKNSWNGAVTVTGNSDTFTVQTAAVPQKECIELAQIAVNPVAVRVNGAAQTLPLNATAVAGACTSATNTIAWDIR